MADINSSLPIRTELAGDVQVKIVDSTNTAQQLTVNADGSLNVITSATNLDIRDLSHTQDSVKIGDGTDFLAVNADGSINSVVTATNLDIRDLAFATDSVTAHQGGTWTIDSITNPVTVTATNLDIRDLAFATDKVDVSGSSVSVSNTVTVQSTNLDIRDLSHTQDSIKVGDGTDFLAVNADGSINVVVSGSAAHTPVQDYNTALVNGSASSTHTYTATANFFLTQIEASATDRIKIEVKVNSVTKAVQFNSSASPNLSITFSEPLMITSGQTIEIVRTNRASQQDIYSTIIGYN